MIASSRWETFNFQSIIPFINVFFSVKTVISATFSTVMMGLWELIWLFRWVWEIPSQRFLIGGKYRITWGPAIHHPCIAPAQDLQTQAVQREERPAYLEKASWVIKRHCISPLPLLDPSRDCDPLSWCGESGDTMPSVTGSQEEQLLIWRLCRTHNSNHSWSLVTGRTLLILWSFEYLPCAQWLFIEGPVSCNHLNQFCHQRNVLAAPWKKTSLQLDSRDRIWGECFDGFSPVRVYWTSASWFIVWS